MQVIQKTRKRGRPRKHFTERHLHIILDENTYQKLDNFCAQNFISKQDLIYNLVIDFLENRVILNDRFTTQQSKRKDYYTEFVRWVLYDAIQQITLRHKIHIRIPRRKLMEYLGKVGLIPHRATLDRYVRKMEAENICRQNAIAKDIRIIAWPALFRKYLPDIYPKYSSEIEAWHKKRLEKVFERYNY